MRHSKLVLSLSLLLAVGLLGCSREAPAPVTPEAPQPVANVAPSGLPGGVVVGGPGEQQPKDGPPGPALDTTAQEKYDAALQDAFSLLADRKYPEALAALEAARSFKDSEFLKAEAGKLKTRLEQQAAAEKTVLDVQTVLDQGKTAEAGQLANAALAQYGGTDAAPGLVKLKLQTDALISAQLAKNPAKHKRFREEGEAALKEKNLRAAALALEQALQSGDDPALRKQYEDIQASLKRYDECRGKAVELRRDPATLEDALAQLKEAARAWDTLQVRQEIDEYTVCLQNRRERAGVAEFEVRGDVGIPAAGRTLADELLPLLKPKFDLVERGQLARVVEDLKLSPSQLGESGGDQKEVGRLAKLRYLVVGSVTQVGGITVHARLVDVRTGLIVQTAKVVAPTPEQAVGQMPELARLLLMSDEQRLAYEQQKTQVAQAPPPVAEAAPLPPPPEVPAADQPPPPPVVLDTPCPPPPGGVALVDFQKLAPPPAGQAVPVVAVGGAAEVVVKRRLLSVSLEVGDNLFRRGRFREAARHFEFALSLSPGDADLRVRVDRCRPLLPPPPPPPVVVVVDPPPPPPPPRPRIAVLDFVVTGDPAVVPPGLRAWAPQHLAPYLSPPYEVVDRGEVFWYMGRMGMTLRDLMTDPAARRWLGRALNVRAFVLGTVRQTDSCEVTTYLLDAESGFLQGSGRVQVRDPFELKLRLGELARLTLMSPAERLQYEQQAQPVEGLLVQARECSGRGQFQLSIQFYRKALRLRPANVQVLVQLEDCNRRAEREAWEAARRAEAERLRQEALAWQERQMELARQAELARVRAAEEFAALTADRRAFLEQQRLQQQQNAQVQLVVQAQFAFKRGDFQVSVRLYEGAAGLRPDDNVYRDLARARAELERIQQQRAAEEQALRDARVRRQQEEELARVRVQLEKERQGRLEAERARREADYKRLVAEGQRLLAARQYDAAVAALRSARQIDQRAEVEAQLNAALVAQARALATSEQARRDLERQLAQEKERRLAAEAEAKRNQELYLGALQLAQKALAEKNYEVAVAKYEQAGKVFRTDVVLSGLRAAQAGQAEVRTKAALQLKKKTEDEQRAANLKRLVADGQAALAANNPDKAVQAFREAKKLAPADIDVLAGLSKAEQTRERAAAEARRRAEDEARGATFRRLLESGQANLAGKKYDAAVLALDEALKLKPGDPAALQARASAQKALQQAGVDAKAAEANRQKAAAYQKALNDGRLALGARQFDAAIQAFSEAQKLLPGDQASANFLKDARKAKDDAQAAVAAEAKRRAEEAQRAASLQKALGEGRAALAAGNLQGASVALATAAKLAPKDPGVLAAQADLSKAQQAQQAEAAARQGREKQYQSLLASGRAALAAKRYDDAEKSFTQATALVPGDKTGLDLVQQARKARADALASAGALKQKQAQEQQARQVQQLLDAGRASLKAGQLDAAAKSFAAAERLAPKDAAVAAALRDLAQARQAAGAAAEKARVQAAYRQALDSGQQALNARRYADAVKAFTEAGRLMPGDPTAAKLLAEAQRAGGAAQAADAEAQKRAERVRQLLQAGQNALKARQFDAAAKTLNEAKGLAPQDPAVQKALQELDAARRGAAGDAEKAKRQASYQQALTTGRQALAAKRYADAVKAFTEAAQLMPGDPTAAALLNQARAEDQAARAAQDREAKARAEEQQRQTAFNTLLAQGQAAQTAKRYADAVRAYAEALKIRPGEPTATRLLREAQAQEAASRPPPPPSPQARAEYDKQMQAGAVLEKQQKLADAVKAYEQALRAIPKDAKATEGYRRVKYALHMGEGRRWLAARRFVEAAREFEAALQVVPNDPAATDLLRRARSGKQ
jgi:tetratricopeptide (TPR) repeat protein